MRVTTLLAKSIIKTRCLGYGDVFTETERTMLQQIQLKKRKVKETNGSSPSIAGNLGSIQALA